jgi:Uma2 family endonuclease
MEVVIMSAVSAPTSVDLESPVSRLLTVADLAALPSELPSGPVAYELEDGRLIVMAPPGETHGSCATKFAVYLYLLGEKPGLGKVRSGDVGIILRRNPDRVVGADVVFIANRSLPTQVSREDYLETVPELVVEVRSKNDSVRTVVKKANDYLVAGGRVVWVADPKARTVTEYRSNVEPKIYAKSDDLIVEDIIPGFRLPVEEVFKD